MSKATDFDRQDPEYATFRPTLLTLGPLARTLRAEPAFALDFASLGGDAQGTRSEDWTSAQRSEGEVFHSLEIIIPGFSRTEPQVRYDNGPSKYLRIVSVDTHHHT